MPAQGKELWVMVTICLLVVVGEVAVSPPIGWQLYVVLFQIFVTVIGAAIVWRYGTKGLVEATSRLRDATRIWDEPSIPKTGQPNVQSVSRDVYCMYCGCSLPEDAIYCRRCGKPQR